MKIKSNLLILVISLLILVTVGVLVYLNFKPKPAGILVRSTPSASIYIDGKLIGKTPFTSTYAPGDVLIKLVPESGEVNLLPFETKITLISGVQTVVRREFGLTEDDSSGDIISFDRGGGETSLVVVSKPDNAQVSLDGVARGFSPYKTTSLTSGDHQISVKAEGYVERGMTLNIMEGYRLTAFIKLGKIKEVEAATPAPDPVAQRFVEVLKTPTGTLRVRSEAGTSGEEIAEISVGSKYKWLETNETKSWHKIQYQEPRPGLPNGIAGWISAEYSRIIDGNGAEISE